MEQLGLPDSLLRVTTPDGKKTLVSKRPQTFTVNGPSTFLVPPGEHQVYVIRLDKWWETRPTLTVDAGTQVVLKAIYQVPVTPEANKLNVWTGRVESNLEGDLDLPINFSPGKNFCLKNLTFSSAC